MINYAGLSGLFFRYFRKFPYCYDLSTSAFPSNAASHYSLCKLIPTIRVRKCFFIQDCADNSQCGKKDAVHLIVLRHKKTHFWRKSSSFKSVKLKKKSEAYVCGVRFVIFK